jgi:hypothetical protein
MNTDRIVGAMVYTIVAAVGLVIAILVLAAVLHVFACSIHIESGVEVKHHPAEEAEEPTPTPTPARR